MVFLALRHLISRKRQSLFTLIGIFFGTAAFVIISGFFLGFQGYLTDQLVSGDAHVKVTRNDEKVGAETIVEYLFPSTSKVSWIRPPNPRLNVTRLNNIQAWQERSKNDSRIVTVGFQYSTTALVQKGGLSQSVSLIGTEPERQIQITNIESKMKAGSFLALAGGMDRLIIGETLANDLAISVGDYVLVTRASGTNFPMKVVGVYSSGNRMSDRATVYVSLSTGQKLGGQNGEVNQVSIRLKDSMAASAYAAEQRLYTKDKVESWDEANASFLSIFRTQDVMRYTTISILLLVAGFGIYNVLTMVVVQKQKDIAILRSMGFGPNAILTLFLLQGAVLGILGSLFGTIIGYFICIFLTGFSMGGPMGNESIHIAFNTSIYFNAFILGIGSSCLAAYIPSRSASKMTPIDIIRRGVE